VSDTPPRDLGELLRRLRTGRSLKMATVIERLQVPKATAYWWETSRGRPEPEQLQRLLDLYNASPTDRLKAWELRTSNPLETAPTDPLDPPTPV
jgi:transcriptional regulator with XRE-family HTH domain